MYNACKHGCSLIYNLHTFAAGMALELEAVAPVAALLGEAYIYIHIYFFSHTIHLFCYPDYTCIYTCIDTYAAVNVI